MDFSLYIHIPFCKKKCDYCDFFSLGAAERVGASGLSDAYISALIKEAQIYADFYGISEWRSVYVGGGTPSQLSAGQLFWLITEIKKIARAGAEAEITVELNPDDVREDFLKACAESGVNRLSMGIQALDDRALRSVGRGSSVEIILNALSLLKAFWRGRLSVDFIAGLPNHTWKSFESQFGILGENPNIDHVSLYTLTVEEHTPLWRNIESGSIAFSPEKADRMWMTGRNLLEKRGFFQYEVSNFARKGCESRHNSAYWRQESYVGVGAGASGTVYDCAGKSAKKSALRWTNTRSIREYISGVEAQCSGRGGAGEPCESGNLSLLRRETELLDETTLEFEFLMLGFRQRAGVLARDYENRFKKSLSARLGADRSGGVFSRWQKNRLARAETIPNGDTRYFLTRRGILLLNRFLEELL